MSVNSEAFKWYIIIITVKLKRFVISRIFLSLVSWLINTFQCISLDFFLPLTGKCWIFIRLVSRTKYRCKFRVLPPPPSPPPQTKNVVICDWFDLYVICILLFSLWEQVLFFPITLNLLSACSNCFSWIIVLFNSIPIQCSHILLPIFSPTYIFCCCPPFSYSCEHKLYLYCRYLAMLL